MAGWLAAPAGELAWAMAPVPVAEELVEVGAAWPGLTKLTARRGRLAASPREPPKRLGRFLP